MTEAQIKDEIVRLVTIIVDEFEKTVGLLKEIETNKILSKYIKLVEEACDSVNKEYVLDKENIVISDFLRTGSPFQGLSNIDWLYKENYEPGFYMLFPSESFNKKLDMLREKLGDELQVADKFHRQIRTQYKYNIE